MVDMTSLLDVVFILLFALIMNVNITRAEDKEALEIAEAALVQNMEENDQLRSSLEVSEMDASEQSEALQAANEAIDTLEDKLVNQKAVMDQRQAILDVLSEQLSDLLQQEVSLKSEDIPDEWLAELDSEGVLVEEWLKYKQIAERYLFVEVEIEGEFGRVYVDGEYTKINLEYDIVKIKEQRIELEEELGSYMLDWLDHKVGGYSFIFVSVTADEDVDRESRLALFNALQKLQTAFDKEQYLINQFVNYQ